MTPPPPTRNLGRNARAELLREFAGLLHRANSQYDEKTREAGCAVYERPGHPRIIPKENTQGSKQLS
jgi:hypothetical protein